MRRRTAAAWTTIALLLVAACAPAAPAAAGASSAPAPTASPVVSSGPTPTPTLTPTVAPTPSPSIATLALTIDPKLEDVRYACDQEHGFDLRVLATAGADELIDHPAASVLRDALGGLLNGDPLQRGWHLVHSDDQSASWVAVSADGQVVSAAVSWIAGAWRLSGIDPCRPMVVGADGKVVNPVEWRVRGAGPGAEVTRFIIDATELHCASGRAMGRRLRAPRIVETPTHVYILVTATRQAQGQDCPGNPSTAIDIGLAAPLGERELVDVSVFPYHDPAKEWP